MAFVVIWRGAEITPQEDGEVVAELALGKLLPVSALGHDGMFVFVFAFVKHVHVCALIIFLE